MKRNQYGFSTAIIAIVLVLLGVACIGMIVWKRSGSTSPTVITGKTITSYADCVNTGYPVMESFPQQCTADGKTFSDPSQKAVPPTAPEQHYLTIKEWGIRIPISKAENNDDMIYTYRKDDSYESAFFTFTRLVDFGICKSDIGVALSRSKVKNVPPYSIDNPEQIAQAGGYYYSASYGGSYCYDNENSKETAFYTATGISYTTVISALKKLELSEGL